MTPQEELEARLTLEGRLIIPTQSVFVFGSNEGGHHGAGAARYAAERRHAKRGVSFGPTGSSFAIPTKDAQIRYTLPMDDIRRYVNMFIEYAKKNYDTMFQVTMIGCGLAGLKNEDVAPLFNHAPPNCLFDTDWEPFMVARIKFWGHF